MVDQELLDRLDRWHEENQHRKIIQEIEALPEEVRPDYLIQGRLARALNNTGRYEEAIRLLESIREPGEQDHRWWSRMGYAYYQLGRYDSARKCFIRALELDPGNEDAKTFLSWMGLRANGSGVQNSWKDEPDQKPQPQRAASNGWERETGVPRELKPKGSAGVQNGWAQQKAPAQGKPRTRGAGNDWEGRGWEGTALLETVLFGTLRFPVKEGLFEVVSLPLGEKTRMVDLSIQEDLARPETWEPLAALLNRVTELYRKAGEKLERDGETVFCVPELREIALRRGEDGGVRCGFLFSPEPEGKDITVLFDLEGNLTER